MNAPATASDQPSAFRHKAMLLGAEESILGIATEPERLDPSRPVCLVLNAGIIHRIGAHRNAVRIARTLAKAGFVVVRVDLSGIGDSPRRRDALDFGTSAVADIGELCDHLGSIYDTERFVPIGLCSGADNAFQAAVGDERLVGAAFLDGYAYPTPEFQLRRIASRIRGQGTAKKIARKVAGRVVDRAVALGQRRLPSVFGALPEAAPSASPPSVVPDYVREFPPRDEVAGQLQQLVDRDFEMLWLFTGGVARYFNYAGQVRDAFPDVDFADRLEVVHIKQANHTATALGSQIAIADAIARWAARCF